MVGANTTNNAIIMHTQIKNELVAAHHSGEEAKLIWEDKTRYTLTYMRKSTRYMKKMCHLLSPTCR